ncbi:hypothetical protein T484DRAFT_1852110, partial [Baffinella frigidus]
MAHAQCDGCYEEPRSSGDSGDAWDRQHLTSFPLFRSLDMQDLEAIESLLEAQAIPRGCVLFEQGEMVSGMFFIVSGQVIASVDDHPIGTIGRGEVVSAEVFHRAFK